MSIMSSPCSITAITAKHSWVAQEMWSLRLGGMTRAQACVDAPLARVVSARGQERKRWAPVPLSTLEMQKRCTQYLRMPGEWAYCSLLSLGISEEGGRYDRAQPEQMVSTTSESSLWP